MSSNHREKIQSISYWATTISLFIVLAIFLFEQCELRLQEEKNLQLLAESLKIEIDYNLMTVEGFENQVDRISKTDETFIPRFSTVVIEESIKSSKFGIKEVIVPLSNGTIVNLKIKILLRDVYSEMIVANKMLDLSGDMVFFGNETLEMFIKAKARNFEKINPEIQKIKDNLILLKQYLQEAYAV